MPREPTPQEVGVIAGISKVSSGQHVISLSQQQVRLLLCPTVCSAVSLYAAHLGQQEFGAAAYREGRSHRRLAT
jgi:hypothetical protein